MPFVVAQWERLCLPVLEMQVRSWGQEYPLEKEMATQSSILAWEIPPTKESGGLQSMGSQKGGHNLVTKHQQQQQCPPAGTPPFQALFTSCILQVSSM